MVPLRDDNPTTITPYVTYGLIAANILVFLFELTVSQTPGQLERFFYTWAVVPKQLTASFAGQAISGPPEWLTLFSSQFLHGGFLHVAGNMLFLWIFGNNVEDRLGHDHWPSSTSSCKPDLLIVSAEEATSHSA